MAEKKKEDLMEKIVSLAKRRGFVFQSSEIYGGLSSCWDYGPMGIELKRNVKNAWWDYMILKRDDVEGIDCSILMAPQVWVASGHLKNFTDPLVDCKECKKRWRQDKLEDQSKCPECGGGLTEARNFNLMFKTFMGPLEDAGAIVYMRPETAQGMFVNFKNVVNSSRQKPPFGIGQIGKSFRNEITPGNFVFRTREFEQMEMEFFVPPEEDEKWYEYWKNQRLQWYHIYGIRPDNLRLREHDKSELAHYAKACADVEFMYPWGWDELEGIANRTDFDLKTHQEHSGKDLTYFDDQTKERYLPFVIEPAAGADRATLAFLLDAYDEEVKENGETRVVLHFHPKLAPVKVAVFPLMKKDGLDEIAKKIATDLKEDFTTFYDQSGAIGRRYARQDEIGTPFCLTIDYDTKEDNAVTLRHRDSMEQKRVKIEDLTRVLKEEIKNWKR
ncbi:MAG: glycine--tRNA ligase [Spirochaetes bacterium GWF1_31_7]|nr:MAG: glycine--tRNA ligase [Spirochaetes bacterium GWE1_32_154]OHD48331.1 MAG: glycine--tRNA ligase [Spirochaetes bacterium GWE2_31_10]OHD53023.1 MAG: glycine--tRNA ligase [Spirochaetes bacterium GWF1_31_7]HBD95254.1 glycine--tRNA ligase [Spirochaetia bacterium]HBI37603.1 glycine--tRNA ligase [Spirochaetia bacterium]